MKRYFGQAYGRVQGVGFRYFVQSAAKKLGLTGWVKNMDDGCVTMQVQGEEKNINGLFIKIKQGNMFIKASKFTTKEINCIDAEQDFDIKY